VSVSEVIHEEKSSPACYNNQEKIVILKKESLKSKYWSVRLDHMCKQHAYILLLFAFVL
jgi:hypothetical protein